MKPLFTDNKFHVLGVPEVAPKAKADEPAKSEQKAADLVPTGRRLSGELGRFEVTGDPRDHGAIKTPTLRNSEVSGPYMHNGAFATLEEVVDFYTKGGGDVDNRSKLVTPLKLTAQEQKALIAFLKALTDTPLKKWASGYSGSIANARSMDARPFSTPFPSSLIRPAKRTSHPP